MSAPNPRHSIEQAQRAYFLSQVTDVRQSPAITAITPAGTAILEIPYYGRTHGAVQVYSTDGAAFVATFKVQGTLLGGFVTADPTTFLPQFTTQSTDNDYVDITGLTSLSSAGIYQMPSDATFSRIRVICTAYTSGNPGIRVL